MHDLPAALAGYGVVYFGNDWHAENRTSSHHIAARLAKRLPVLYVDSPGLRAPSANSRDLARSLRKLREAFRPPRRVCDGLWHCTVPQLPFRRMPGVGAVNRIFGRWAVRRALARIGLARCISWFMVPHPGALAGTVGDVLCVYYCIDDYAAHPGVDSGRVTRFDEALTRKADLVFVAPPALVEPKRALNPAAVYAPHGVDAELFARASDPATVAAPGARLLAAPVVGYFGSIHEWIDVPLLEWLARQRPDWTFLLVGHAAVAVDGLARLANVRLPGPQPYADLPRWARVFDAAIIPYRLNQQVANANPLKLREYLATGKPIVSVRNPEIEKFAAHVRIVDGRDQFLAALDLAVRDKDPDAARARMASVADQGWDRRVDTVLARVGDEISRRALDASAHARVMASP